MYPDIPYSKEHKQLRRRLVSYKWSRQELEWLARHAKGFPSSLEKLIHAKLAEAEDAEQDDLSLLPF